MSSSARWDLRGGRAEPTNTAKTRPYRDLRMLGIPSTDPVALTLDGTPGRGICVGFGGDPRPSACQVAWLDQRAAVAAITPAAPQGLQHIAPAADPDGGAGAPEEA